MIHPFLYSVIFAISEVFYSYVDQPYMVTLNNIFDFGYRRIVAGTVGQVSVWGLGVFPPSLLGNYLC